MNLTRPLRKHDTNYEFTCVASFEYLYKSVLPSLKERQEPFYFPRERSLAPKTP